MFTDTYLILSHILPTCFTANDILLCFHSFHS